MPQLPPPLSKHRRLCWLLTVHFSFVYLGTFNISGLKYYFLFSVWIILYKNKCLGDLSMLLHGAVVCWWMTVQYSYLKKPQFIFSTLLVMNTWFFVCFFLVLSYYETCYFLVAYYVLGYYTHTWTRLWINTRVCFILDIYSGGELFGSRECICSVSFSNDSYYFHSPSSTVWTFLLS